MNIFIGNLAFTATEEDLRQLFEPYGAVDTINLITDRDTGRARGFGFVEMPDSRAALSAMQGLQGKDLAGRALTVNEAKPREPRRKPSRSHWQVPCVRDGSPPGWPVLWWEKSPAHAKIGQPHPTMCRLCGTAQLSSIRSTTLPLPDAVRRRGG